MIDYKDYGVVWYAMKTTYKKELRAKAYLDSLNIENFIPMKHEVSNKYGRKTATQRPAIHNLIFVKTDLITLKDIKLSLNYLHNCLMLKNNILQPIVVPTEQMEQFIAAVTMMLDKIVCVDISLLRLEKGVPVRIIGGEFEGYVGTLEKVKGKRNRRVYVNIEGVVAYKFEVDARFVEKL